MKSAPGALYFQSPRTQRYYPQWHTTVTLESADVFFMCAERLHDSPWWRVYRRLQRRSVRGKADSDCGIRPLLGATAAVVTTCHFKAIQHEHINLRHVRRACIKCFVLSMQMN